MNMIKNATVLLVDDDTLLCDSLKKYLSRFNFDVTPVHSGAECIEKVKAGPYDVIILDYMLPDNFNGLQVCSEVRRISPTMPIIMLTARGDPADRVTGLETGADDYLSKPFEARELVARLNALIRRSSLQTPPAAPAPAREILHFEDLEIDLFKRVARLAGANLYLTTAEFTVLETLMQNPGRPYNRDELCRSLKGFDWEVSDRSLDILVSKLRQKLKENPKDPRFIKTVWGSGYMFIGKNGP